MFTEFKKIYNLKSLMLESKDYMDVQREHFYDIRCDEPITSINFPNKWKNQTENIGAFFKTNVICLPLREKDKLDLILNVDNDLSIAVFTNSAKIAFFSVKEKFYGYGLNNYESSLAKQMVNNIVPTYFKEVYFLNYNDASSSLWKLISEFGIFSGLFLTFLTINISLNSLILNTLQIRAARLSSFIRALSQGNE
jgi:hypothetical protein